MSATVRTFRAPNSQSALAAVKAALGPDAVLISTRTVPGGLWKKPEVEVVAALGEAFEGRATSTPTWSANPPPTSRNASGTANLSVRPEARAAEPSAEEWISTYPASVRAQRRPEPRHAQPVSRPADDPLFSEVQALRRS